MPHTTRRRARYPGLAAAALHAAAQSGAFPSRPIRLVVPHAPGGNSDTFGRIQALGLRERIGLQVVVEHRVDAGSS